jgi:uncharacterized protein (DUF2252 family)
MARENSSSGARAPAATVPHLTVGEHAEAGKRARQTVPRSSLATWSAAPDRPDPVEILEEQARSRVQELVPIRYGRMLLSPFAFYRGAAAIMASDLASVPNTALRVQLCGDAHVSNFGLFASPERSLVFDINDFDETLPGPWEWDLKRLVASLAIAGRADGFDEAQRHGVTVECASSYRAAMQGFASRAELEVWYSRTQVQEGLPRLRKLLHKKELKQVEAVVEKARTRDSMQAFAKFTEVVDAGPRIKTVPPLVVAARDLFPPDEAAESHAEIQQLLRSYRRTLPRDRRHLLERFRFVDLARKVVGVGSVGTRAWILLLLGRDDQDPLFLQAKEAEASVLEGFAGRSEFASHGQRVVEGQKLMQATSDIFLGWERVRGFDDVERHYYMRQLRDWKGSWNPDVMDDREMTIYARMCGWTLARAHARSGDRIAIAAYCGNSDKLDRALATFAESYADQNEADYEALRVAVKEGRVEAKTG